MLLGAGNGVHAFMWRDVYDIAVRWRQVADPYDPVFYFDGLSKATVDDGLFLRTYLTFEEMRVNKYYSQVRRVFALARAYDVSLV